jgi:hypothetical protein
LGLVFFTDTKCHKTATNLTPSTSLLHVPFSTPLTPQLSVYQNWTVTASEMDVLNKKPHRRPSERRYTKTEYRMDGSRYMKSAYRRTVKE